MISQPDMFERFIPPSGIQDTLTAARDRLFRNLDKGSRCPCCDQHAMRYRRHINAGMARALILMVKESAVSGDMIDIKKLDVRGGDYAKLRYWGLIKQLRNTEERSGTRSGLWRVTDIGVAFANNESSVTGIAIVYNDECERLTGDQVTIVGALGKKFSYEELMSGHKTEIK